MNFFQILFLFLFSVLQSQNTGFTVLNADKTVISFKLINNLIFIPVTVNGVELTFLLDSGVHETLLFSLENKEVNFNDVEKISFSGLGEDIDLEGLKSVNNTVCIGKEYTDSRHTIYIILNEDINFSDHVGIPVNGIIGYYFFKNYPVQIDYVRKKITIFKNQELYRKITKNFEEFPITLELNKPYLYADVEMTHEKKSNKLLIDLGNSDSVWLFPALIKDFVYNRPNIEDFLGRGFNGDIYGKRSRIHGFYLGKFKFEKPLVAMPDEYSIQHLKLVKDRKGSVGSEILRRFKVVLDYPNSKILLKANKHYRDPFLFNKSGMDIKHDGMSWEQDLVQVETKKKENEGIEVYHARQEFQYRFVLKPQYSVAGCRIDSPCEKAGILKGDQLIRIGNKKTSGLSLEKINDMLRDEEGKYLEIEISRDGKIIRTGFYLKDPIPYQEQENL